MKEKTLELKKPLNHKNKIRKKKNKQNTIPEGLITTKDRQTINENPIQGMEKFGRDRTADLPGITETPKSTMNIL